MQVGDKVKLVPSKELIEVTLLENTNLFADDPCWWIVEFEDNSRWIYHEDHLEKLDT